jgi:glycosyltransferase involved in cell wall biosynthesis
MANILVISSEYLPLYSSGINRIDFFKRSMEKEGHTVHVLTTNSNALGLKSNADFDKKNRINRSYSLPLLLRRILSSRRLPIYPTLSTKGKYDVWIPFAVKQGLKLVKQHDIDIVFTSFPDFASVEVAFKIAQKTDTKLITEFRDPPFWIYDETDASRKTKICQKIVQKAISLSHHIITCTEQSADSLRSFYEISQNITVIGNGYDQEIIDKIKAIKIENKNEYEIVHIGSFYDEGRDIKPIVSAIEKYCKNAADNISLRLIGDEPDLHTQQFINNTALSFRVSIEPPIPMIEALTVAKNADALLLLQGSRFDRQIPTKVYEYLALQKPIWAVVGAKGATRLLLTKYPQNVIYSDYDDNGMIDKGLLQTLTTKEVPCNIVELSRQTQIKLLNDVIT